MARASAFMTLFASEPRKTRLRRVAFQVHLYAGLGVAIMMVAMGVSGSAIAVREPIQFALHRSVNGNEASPTVVSIDRSLRVFHASHPDKSIAAILGFERNDGVLALQTKDKAGGPDRFFFIDRGTGLEVQSHERLSAVFDYLDDFHRNLLAGHKGRAINGFVAMLFCVTTLTGVVVWWPGASRWTRSLFINLNLSWKRINYDLHSAAGFYCYLFLLLMSVTAVALATPSVPELFAFGRSGGDQQHRHHDHIGGKTERPTGLKASAEDDTHRKHETAQPAAKGHDDVDALLTALPGIIQPLREQLRAIELDDSGIPSRLELGQGEKTVIALWDATSESLTSEQQTRVPGTSLDAHGVIDVVHFGRFGGIWTQLLWCVLGLSPVILASTGVLMWWNRVLSKRIKHAS